MNRYSHILAAFLISLMISVPGFMYAASHAVPGSETVQADSIYIGLLLTEDPESSSLMREAAELARLAEEIANENGGIRQQPVKIVVKSVDGNWGAGSKQAVDLITDHQAAALLGFVDGRSAHLIEQVCTKAEIPFISTFSPDPSLSRINISWFFSTLPHAEQQSAVLTEQLYGEDNNLNTLVISSDDYDRQFISRSFINIARNTYGTTPEIFSYSSGNEDFRGVVSRISETEPAALAFFGSADELNILTERLSKNGIQLPVYVPVMDVGKSPSDHYGGPIYALSPKNRDHQRTEGFLARFYERHGYRPGLQTAYLADGIQLLFESIREGGYESDKIREALSTMDDPASFDSQGVIEQPLTVYRVW